MTTFLEAKLLCSANLEGEMKLKMFVLFSFSMLKSLQHTGEALMCSTIPVLRSSSTFSNLENTIKILLLHCNITYLT